MGTFGTLKLTS
jgi:ATP-dependent Lon protease